MDHGRTRRTTLTTAVVVGVALSVLGGAHTSPAASSEQVRLLVTYARPTDGDDVEASFRTAQVVADEHRPTSRLQVLEFGSAAAAARAARDLRRDDRVVAVEPDAVIHLEPVATTSSVPGSVPASTLPNGASDAEVGVSATSALSTSDSDLAPQVWPIRNRGQQLGGTAGRRGVDVGAVDAWPYATGRGVVVAVIDAGMEIEHPALAGQIWRNPRERADGRDTDGNGFVDDLHGWNFVHDDNQLYRNAEADMHGTLVAGAIVAARDPQTGSSGVAPDARVMPLKFIDGSQGFTSDAVAAVRYAAANGAHVINLSFGGPQASRALELALAESGLPVVAAAGNHGASLEVEPMYPAAHDIPNLATVAAVTNTGDLAAFSGYSRRIVDVAAPGQHIYTTTPGGDRGYASGTSLATPLVAGTLALALEAHPETDPETLIDTLRRSARPLEGADATIAGGIAMAPALLAALGTEVPVCTGELTTFADVRSTSVHHDAVGCLVATGVTVGTTSTTFTPDGELTRGQVASLLARIIDRAGLLPPPPSSHRFEDTQGSVHGDNLEILAALDILQVSGDRVGTGEVVSRAEFATLAARTAELFVHGTIRLALFPELSSDGFADLASTTTRDEVLKAAAIRVTTGRTVDSFDPDSPVRRDQAASMLVRLLARLGEQGLIDPA